MKILQLLVECILKELNGTLKLISLANHLPKYCTVYSPYFFYDHQKNFKNWKDFDMNVLCIKQVREEVYFQQQDIQLTLSCT